MRLGLSTAPRIFTMLLRPVLRILKDINVSVIKTWSFQWSTTQSNMSSKRREMLALLMAYQALCRKLNNCTLRSAMVSLLLSNNVPFHVVKKMGRWKSNDTVDTFYDKRIIGEKSGGLLNNVVQLS
ncbi:hypothetical protein ACTFIZ_002944 [Dictyostelium cf. discoideum]